MTATQRISPAPDSTVYVIDDEGRIDFRRVEVLKAGIETVVLQGGLEQGERICLSPLDAATQGMRVRTDETGAAPAGPGEGDE